MTRLEGSPVATAHKTTGVGFGGDTGVGPLRQSAWNLGEGQPGSQPRIYNGGGGTTYTWSVSDSADGHYDDGNLS